MTHEQARLELYLMLKSVDDRDISRGMHSTITAIHLRRGNAFICACMCSTSKHKSSHSWKSTAGVCVCVCMLTVPINSQATLLPFIDLPFRLSVNQ